MYLGTSLQQDFYLFRTYITRWWFKCFGELFVYQSILVYFISAQWIKYYTCEPQITSSNLPGPFVQIYWITKYILFIRHAIFHNQLIFCWFVLWNSLKQLELYFFPEIYFAQKACYYACSSTFMTNKTRTLLQDFFRIMENITPIFVQVQDDNNVGMLQLVA